MNSIKHRLDRMRDSAVDRVAVPQNLDPEPMLPEIPKDKPSQRANTRSWEPQGETDAPLSDAGSDLDETDAMYAEMSREIHGMKDSTDGGRYEWRGRDGCVFQERL